MTEDREILADKTRLLSELETLTPVDETEFSVGKKTYAACKAAGGAMVGAMLASAKSRDVEERAEACRLAGVSSEEQEKDAQLAARAKDAVGAFADAHLKAHSLQYMEEFRLYSLADRSVYGEIAPFRYDRDLVDTLVAREARQKWNKLSIAPPDKSALLVGKYAENAEAVFDVNCHSPIPMKGASSKVVRVAEGALHYNVLKGEKLENNELSAQIKEKEPEKTIEKPEIKKSAPERGKEEEPRRAKLPDTAPVRPHPEDPDDPARKRTAIAAEILFAEKKARGVQLSPDPMLSRQLKFPQVKAQ